VTRSQSNCRIITGRERDGVVVDDEAFDFSAWSDGTACCSEAIESESEKAVAEADGLVDDDAALEALAVLALEARLPSTWTGGVVLMLASFLSPVMRCLTSDGRSARSIASMRSCSKS
jgi:hypothetical protein